MGLVDVIKYEGGNDVLVYKHPVEDFNTGSQLIVHESQEAIFFLNGKAMDHFGPGKHTLETESLPLMKGFFKKIANGPTQFHSEVYFVNLATIMGLKWGTDSKVRMFDPSSGMHVELGAFGEFNIRVSDPGKLLVKLVGNELGLAKDDTCACGETSIASASSLFRALIMSKVKSFLPKAIRENYINVLEVDEHIDEIGEYIKSELNKTFESYGLHVSEFYLNSIQTPDDDPNFRRLKEQHAERYLKVQDEKIKQAEAEARRGRVVVEAETDAEVKIIGVKAEEEAVRRMAYAEAERERAQGLAHADAVKAMGGNYQMETSRIVGQAVAENESQSSGAGMIGGMTSDIVKTGVGLGVGVGVAKTMASSVGGVMKDIMGSAPSGVSTWTCPECGSTGNDGKFCKECGHKRETQPSTWFCPDCGASNSGKFCTNCGKKRD